MVFILEVTKSKVKSYRVQAIGYDLGEGEHILPLMRISMDFKHKRLF